MKRAAIALLLFLSLNSCSSNGSAPPGTKNTCEVDAWLPPPGPNRSYQVHVIWDMEDPGSRYIHDLQDMGETDANGCRKYHFVTEELTSGNEYDVLVYTLIGGTPVESGGQRIQYNGEDELEWDFCEQP